ncbi:hypothetical protein SAMN05880590_101454 [Rhizobium sp. RU35A]|uniref:DUF2087 domain-containing protein n=1 Tax=Rhizobium sp. RU35A TaxID=1907414 RepID=UPI000954F481|nr:DUF2087 domain-containing protein [Rhizobium sp. RU35A]SIP96115.1 hypothetical protein SAMN05880590_101454 [Rhizobium sp. RU35A]
MSKTLHAVTIPDLSALAKILRRELYARDTPPSHVELLNLLARGAGFRNFQHLKASHAAAARLEAAPEPVEAEPVDHRRIELVLRCFDDEAVMARWPKKTAQQKLALWWCWASLPARRELSEPEVNAILKALNGFGDHVLIRRELVDWGMVARSPDCRIYRRIETRPPADAAALIAHLQARKRAKRVPRVSNRPPFTPVRSPARPDASPTSP